jgi:hypothetical protein
MSFSDLFAYFVSLCLAGLGVLALMGVMRAYWSSKLRGWAKGEGFRMVSFRGARFQEGPQKMRSRRSERLFRVAVEDGLKTRRSGWVMFGGFWGMGGAHATAKVMWDEWDD